MSGTRRGPVVNEGSARAAVGRGRGQEREGRLAGRNRRTARSTSPSAGAGTTPRVRHPLPSHPPCPDKSAVRSSGFGNGSGIGISSLPPSLARRSDRCDSATTHASPRTRSCVRVPSASGSHLQPPLPHVLAHPSVVLRSVPSRLRLRRGCKTRLSRAVRRRFDYLIFNRPHVRRACVMRVPADTTDRSAAHRTGPIGDGRPCVAGRVLDRSIARRCLPGLGPMPPALPLTQPVPQ